MDIITTQFPPVDIFFTSLNRSIIAVTLTSGTNYQAGDPLAIVTATGQAVIHAPLATDGSEVCIGILLQNANALASTSGGQGGPIPAGMVISGQMNNGVLNRGAGMTGKAISDLHGKVLVPQNAFIF